MNFFKEIENIIVANNVVEKLTLFKEFYTVYQKNNSYHDDFFSMLPTDNYPKLFQEPSYSNFCQVVPPQNVPKRRNLTTLQGQVIFVHAVAHIEYSAIDLALDSAYRFPNMSKSYYDDWLEVASDEIRHFEMLETLLLELGSYYGEIEVHNALFEASQRTQSFIDRMAVVPRYLEANGLDATPEILEKLKRLPKSIMIDKISSALTIILEEEVDHVLKGDTWFEYACAQEKKDKSVYFDIIDKYYPKTFEKKRSLNISGRKDAGFSCSELNRMVNKKVC
jgi:uncharacterized ferritin-like protein (DUF455 family)